MHAIVGTWISAASLVLFTGVSTRPPDPPIATAAGSTSAEVRREAVPARLPGPKSFEGIRPRKFPSVNVPADVVPYAPCGIYTTAASFDADHGPFDRSLGNFEDFELTNAAPDELCVVDVPGTMDCAQHLDPTGTFCGGFALDAGDILTGLQVDTAPKRGPGWWEALVVGATMNMSRHVMPNYFGDSMTLSFPNAGVPSGCETAAPGPSVVGFIGQSPWITVSLADGTAMSFKTDATPQFVGICCPQEIVGVTLAGDPSTGFTPFVDDVRYGQSVPGAACQFPGFAAPGGGRGR